MNIIVYPVTREAAIERHRELWNKCAEIIARDEVKSENYEFAHEWIIVLKEHALRELGYDADYIDNECWCCEYVCQHYSAGTCNEHCPIEWNVNNKKEVAACCKGSSPYHKLVWGRCNKKAQIKYAKMIANLPERFKEV